MDAKDFETIPRRVFLDTCIVNLTLDYGPQIHEGEPLPDDVDPRLSADVESLGGIFATGQRAFWQFAISPHTYHEIVATREPTRCYELQRWFFEVWGYWREFFHNAPDLAAFSEAEETRIELISSGVLDILPDLGDRVLICDAVVYHCDAFCTRDWRTVLKHRDQLREIPLRIITPTEWWAQIQPWATTWL